MGLHTCTHSAGQAGSNTGTTSCCSPQPHSDCSSTVCCLCRLVALVAYAIVRPSLVSGKHWGARAVREGLTIHSDIDGRVEGYRVEKRVPRDLPHKAKPAARLSGNAETVLASSERCDERPPNICAVGAGRAGHHRWGGKVCRLATKLVDRAGGVWKDQRCSYPLQLCTKREGCAVLVQVERLGTRPAGRHLRLAALDAEGIRRRTGICTQQEIPTGSGQRETALLTQIYVYAAAWPCLNSTLRARGTQHAVRYVHNDTRVCGVPHAAVSLTVQAECPVDGGCEGWALHAEGLIRPIGSHTPRGDGVARAVLAHKQVHV